MSNPNPTTTTFAKCDECARPMDASTDAYNEDGEHRRVCDECADVLYSEGWRWI